MSKNMDEIPFSRSLALNAAVKLFSGDGNWNQGVRYEALKTAKLFEEYLETGTWTPRTDG